MSTRKHAGRDEISRMIPLGAAVQQSGPQRLRIGQFSALKVVISARSAPQAFTFRIRRFVR